MNILVTGAGVIGCHTARLLHEQGHGVVLLDVAPNMEAIGSIIDIQAISIAVLDVTDCGALEKIIKEKGVERIIHTAALMTAACRQNPYRGIDVNVIGTTAVLDCARRGLVSRVVHSSSNVVDAPETSVYALTKMMSERVAKMYRTSYGVEAVSLRYAAVLGTWKGPPTSIPARLLRLLVDAAVQRRAAVIDDPMLIWQGVDSFVDARDCAAANVAAALAEKPVTAVYDVAPSRGLAFDDIIEAIKHRYADFKTDFRVSTDKGFAGYPVKTDIKIDTTIAQREIGFTARHSIGDTVEEAARFASTS
jgi:nucleoside-diphosphate-sugar epimerase